MFMRFTLVESGKKMGVVDGGDDLEVPARWFVATNTSSSVATMINGWQLLINELGLSIKALLICSRR
jgi:hypothetical protein